MEVQFKLQHNGRGSFSVEVGGKQIGRMDVGIANGNLTVYHTEVDAGFQGKGFSGELLSAMIDYARTHALKVIPLCEYVNAQFRRHPDLYRDIWNTEWHNEKQ
jgi:predicted GNAT family acetyltransferase